jgi:sulfite exporter TauE/SafE
MSLLVPLSSAFFLGLLTSLHCVGMCGPLALALPLTGDTRARYIAGRLIYNLGRAVTYASMGLILGLVGQAFSFGGYQRWISFSVGVVLLTGVMLTRTGLMNNLLNRIGLFGLFARFHATWTRKFKRGSLAGLFILGLINGLLPCGPVYVALGAAATTGRADLSGLFMLVFGIGTLPLMLGVSLAGKLVQVPIRRKLQRLIPVSAGVVAVLLIVRGMALGIPYLSPPIEATSLEGQPHTCCRK